MIIHTLIAQRKCRYEGEYGPEVLAAIDEFGHSDNPDYMAGEVEKAEKHKAEGEYDAFAVIDIDIPMAEVDKRLYPAREPVKGVVK